MKYSQNSPEWYRARLFHFTSSELHRLMSEPKSKTELLSAGAKTYVYDKIAELLTNGASLNDTSFESEATTRGKELEDEAKRGYEKRTGLIVDDCGFIEYNDYFGGSPDGLVGDDGGVEVKCPNNSSNHARYLGLRTQEELRKEEPGYFAQIQGNLLTTGRAWWDFISYEPRCQNPAFRLKILRVLPDEGYIAKAREKLALANRFKNEYIDRLIELC